MFLNLKCLLVQDLYVEHLKLRHMKNRTDKTQYIVVSREQIGKTNLQYKD